MNILKSIKNNMLVLIKFPNLFFCKLFYYLILRKILQQKSDCILNINGCRIVIPNDIIPFMVLEEIFVYEEYKYLKNLNCILDLGGFLGESAIYFAMNNNKKVIIFEPDPTNFKYLVKNVSQFNNIEYYNFAVVNGEKHCSEELIYYKSDEFDYGGNIYNMYNKTNKIKVKSIDIDKIINKYDFDGIKMDIEGGEFEILEYFINNKDNFKFYRGYIEIHFEGKSDHNLHILKKFIDFLADMGYRYAITMNNKKIGLKEVLRLYDNLNSKEWLIFVLYFEKLGKS